MIFLGPLVLFRGNAAAKPPIFQSPSAPGISGFPDEQPSVSPVLHHACGTIFFGTEAFFFFL